MMWHKTKHDWLLYLSVIWPLGWSLAIQGSKGSQTFCCQSEGLAMRVYWTLNEVSSVFGELGRLKSVGVLLGFFLRHPGPGEFHTQGSLN